MGGLDGSKMSSKRIVCELLLVLGVRLGCRSFLFGVWNVYGATQLWRPVNSGGGDEMRYSASPAGPSTSGEELGPREDMATDRALKNDPFSNPQVAERNATSRPNHRRKAQPSITFLAGRLTESIPELRSVSFTSDAREYRGAADRCADSNINKSPDQAVGESRSAAGLLT